MRKNNSLPVHCSPVNISFRKLFSGELLERELVGNNYCVHSSFSSSVIYDASGVRFSSFLKAFKLLGMFIFYDNRLFSMINSYKNTKNKKENTEQFFFSNLG